MYDQKEVHSNSEYCALFETREAELIHFIQQGELFTRFEGGMFPEREDLDGVAKILDVACGTGQWAIEMAEQYPDISFTGIDRRKRMIDYACAGSTNLENVHFLQMDITTQLNLPDRSFDVVNARFLQGILTTEEWQPFLSECIRITRPGGIIRLTEMAFSESNSKAFNHLLSLISQSLYHLGRSFSPDGHTYCTAPTFSSLLRTAGCKVVRFRPFMVDFSCGAEVYEDMVQYLRLTYAPHRLGPFFEKTKVISQQEYQDLYDHAMNDLGSSQFCGMGYLITATGEKPETSVMIIYHDSFMAKP